MRSKTSSVTVSKRPNCTMPATLASTSMPPASAQVATAASTAALSATSHFTRVTPSGTLVAMSSPKTVSPRARNLSAVANPMPEAAPVTTTTRLLMAAT